MENKVKFQHYVPRVYLKNFAAYNGKEYYIWVFDKETEKAFQTNIKDIAFESEFYDKITEEQETEKVLREIESKYDKVISELVRLKDLSHLSSDIIDVIATFISNQMNRTKETRLHFQQTVEKFSNKFHGQLSEKLDEEVKNALTADRLRESHKRFIKDSDIFKRILLEMKWILQINKTKFSLWSSDNPVARYNSLDLSPYGNLGLTSRGIEIHFPISPNLTLLICDPLTFKSVPNKIFLRDYRNIVRERDLQIRDSTRFIFSNENNFSFAKTVLKEKPALKDPNRDRVTIN